MKPAFAPNDAPRTLYPKNRARAERAKALSHLVPAVVLVSGLGPVLIGKEPLVWLRAVELVVGATYLGLLGRELRQQRRHGPAHHERVAWLELAAAGILALEGYHIWHRHHETALRTGVHRFHVLPWLYWAVAGLYVGLAFGMARLHERRYLHLHAGGFSGRLHPFGRQFAFAWTEVARLEPTGPADVLVHQPNGSQQRLSFAKVYEGPAHRDRLVAHAAASGRPA